MSTPELAFANRGAMAARGGAMAAAMAAFAARSLTATYLAFGAADQADKD